MCLPALCRIPSYDPPVTRAVALAPQQICLEQLAAQERRVFKSVIAVQQVVDFGFRVVAANFKLFDEIHKRERLHRAMFALGGPVGQAALRVDIGL